MNRGDIWRALLDYEEDSYIQRGYRPVIVVSNNRANRHSTVVHIVPLTKSRKKKDLPTHVIINSTDILKRSTALVEQTQLVDTYRLIKKVGKISDKEMELINIALLIQFELDLK